MTSVRSLPPAQHAAELARVGLPRFARREVNPPAQPVLIVTGEVRHPTQFDVRELMARLPRRGQRSDLHCVTTWSALDLAWSGTSLWDVIVLIADVMRPHPGAFWLTATGLDGFSSRLRPADALADDVLLLADRLDGAKLTPDHGAPLRLVAPMHYGYKSVKHLTVLEYRRSYTA
jgi:DMSO/TMAO reductase YedYZ molybdopterin-dependent catalytic subunit